MGIFDKRSDSSCVGPRSRAPLGMKTTNAKARAGATPAAPLGTNKPEKSNRKNSTVKKAATNAPLKSAEPELSQKSPDAEDRDVEYMPPKPKGTKTVKLARGIAANISSDLPDPPEDIPYNTDFPQFKGQNLTRGWELLHDDNPIGEDGLTRKERQWRKEQAAHEKRVDDMIQKQFDNMQLVGINVRETPDEPCADEIREKFAAERRGQGRTTRTRTARNVSTVKSRSAVAALSQPPTSIPKPRANPAPKSRPVSSLLTAKKPAPPPSEESSKRHAAATARSRSTLGYTKGRNASSTLAVGQSSKAQADKAPRSPIISQELFKDPAAGEPGFSSGGSLDDAKAEDDDVLDAMPTETLPAYEEDEETANFQLTL